jgi:hypothetical protein
LVRSGGEVDHRNIPQELTNTAWCYGERRKDEENINRN